MVRARRQALPRHGLDLLRRRRRRQAAARRGDPQRDQRRARSPARATSPRARRSRCPAGSATRRCRTCRTPSSASARSSAAPRRCASRVRMFLKYGVDSVKLNLSGEYIAGMPAEFTPMTDEEVAVAVEEAKLRGKRVAAHARSARIDQAVRAPRHRDDLPRELHRRGGARHARGRTRTSIFVAPGLAWLINTCYHASRVGHDARGDGEDGLSPRARGRRSRSLQEDAQARHPHPARRRLRLRLDRRTAPTRKDLEYFVKYLGFTPMEALLVGDQLGGEIMMRRQRARPGEGGLSRRPAAGRRRPARQHRGAAGQAASWR